MTIPPTKNSIPATPAGTRLSLFSGAVFSMLIVFILGFCSNVAQAQQPAKIPWIGILLGSSASFYTARVEAFRQRLGELGYVEGENILTEYRHVEGKAERLPDLVAELVRLKVDIILTSTPSATLAAKKASPTMPIVFSGINDPVGTGIVSNLARPGGNITGLSLMAPDLDGKRLELLKEAFPKVARVAFLWGSGGTRGSFTAMEDVAKALGVKLLSLQVRSLDDFESTFTRAKRDGAQALITTPNPLINTQQRQVLDFAAKNRLPAMYPASELVEAGGLMSYAPSYTDLYRRAADFVDKILKGAKPADLSVEQPKKFELIINLKAAKQIGLTIPNRLLERADKLIR